MSGAKTTHICLHKVWRNFHSHLCAKPGRYEHEGKFYCAIHHPPHIEAKRSKREGEWKEQLERKREINDFMAEMNRLLGSYTLEDLKRAKGVKLI